MKHFRYHSHYDDETIFTLLAPFDSVALDVTDGGPREYEITNHYEGDALYHPRNFHWNAEPKMDHLSIHTTP